MIDIAIPLKRIPGFKVYHRWLYDHPATSDAGRLAVYYQCQSVRPVFGFHREAKFTIITDLKPAAESILAQFEKNTQYEVRRAMKDGVQFEVVVERSEFHNFFGEFALSKNLPAMEGRQLAAYWPNLIVTGALLDVKWAAMHSYLYDGHKKRAVLLHSASLFRNEGESQKRSMIGRANRLLHYQDMLRLKERGAELYDFGGYAKDTQDPDLAGINDFKAGFGGVIIEESNYISVLLHTLRKGKSLLTRV